MKDERITFWLKIKVISEDIKSLEIFRRHFGNIAQNLVIDDRTSVSLDNDIIIIRKTEMLKSAYYKSNTGKHIFDQ